MKEKDETVRHLPHGKAENFTKFVFYYLGADTYSHCETVAKRNAMDLGNGKGMKGPHKLKFIGKKKSYICYTENIKTLKKFNKRLFIKYTF